MNDDAAGAAAAPPDDDEEEDDDDWLIGAKEDTGDDDGGDAAAMIAQVDSEREVVTPGELKRRAMAMDSELGKRNAELMHDVTCFEQEMKWLASCNTVAWAEVWYHDS